MLCYLRALLFKNSWYHYVILQRWGKQSVAVTGDHQIASAMGVVPCSNVTTISKNGSVTSNVTAGASPVSSAFSNATQEYFVCFQRLAEEEIPVTINVIITTEVADEHRIFNDIA